MRTVPLPLRKSFGRSTSQTTVRPPRLTPSDCPCWIAKVSAPEHHPRSGSAAPRVQGQADLQLRASISCPAREQRLLNFFHVEIGPLIGRALVSATEPSPVKLSPRLRQ